MKKPLILFFGLALIFASCKKEYEDKVGTFTGTQSYIDGTDQDTLIFDVTTITYTLSYDKKDKEYSLSNSGGKFPSIVMTREDFEDNSHIKSSVFPAITQTDLTFYEEQQRLVGEYQYTNLDSWRICTFDGIKD